MQIRRLRPDDAAAAVRVIEEVKFPMDNVVGETVSEEYFRDFLADGRHYFLAAYVDERPAGYLFAYRLMRFDGRVPSMFLYEIGVEEAYRRRGIGRALTEEIIRLAQADCCRKMFVPTDRANTAAMALYKSTGGTEGAPDATAFWWNWE